MKKDLIKSTILSYSMGRTLHETIENTKLSGCKKVNIYVVSSNFNIDFTLSDIPINQWKKKFNEIYDFFRLRKECLTRFAIVSNSDNDDNILYCQKII